MLTPSVPDGSITASSLLEPLRSHARDSHGAAEGLRHGFALWSPSSEEWPFRLATQTKAGFSSQTKAGFSASPQKNISRLDGVKQSWRFRGLRGSSCMGDFTSRLHGGQSRTSGGLFCLVPPYSCETGSLTEPMAWLTTSKLRRSSSHCPHSAGFTVVYDDA